jgi:hypothetical protein
MRGAEEPCAIVEISAVGLPCLCERLTLASVGVVKDERCRRNRDRHLAVMDRNLSLRRTSSRRLLITCGMQSSGKYPPPGSSILVVNAFGKLRFNWAKSEVKYRKFPCTGDLEGGS